MAFTYRRDLSAPLSNEQMDGNLDEIETLHDAAATAATAAQAAANFKGAWNLLTGALAIPASASHSGSIWMLDADVADVTSVEPGVTGWTQINTGDVVGPASSVNNSLPRYNGADGNSLKTTGITVTDLDEMTEVLAVRGAQDNTGYLGLTGGQWNHGANIALYGESDASLPNVIRFANGASVERMRIATNGDLLVGGTVTNGFNVNVTGNIFTSGVNRFNVGWVTKVAYNVFQGTAPEDSISTTYDSIAIQSGEHRNLNLSKPEGYTNTSFAGFYVAGSVVGSISTNGTATAYNTTSDYRLKCDWKPIETPLEMIGRLPVYDGEFKTKPGYRVHYGIAHEWQAVLPWAVTGEKDGEEMQTVDYSKAVPLLIAAVQELSKQVAELKSQIGAK